MRSARFTRAGLSIAISSPQMSFSPVTGSNCSILDWLDWNQPPIQHSDPPRPPPPWGARGGAGGAPSGLFAVGAILFEMLAGRPAFIGRTIAEVLNATLTEQPP